MFRLLRLSLNSFTTHRPTTGNPVRLIFTLVEKRNLKSEVIRNTSIVTDRPKKGTKKTFSIKMNPIFQRLVKWKKHVS